MRNVKAVRLLRLATLVLLGLVGLQAYGLRKEGDPLDLTAGGMELTQGPAASAPAPAGDSAPPAGTPPAGDSAAPPALPEKYRSIEASGIFGREPQREISPSLLGLAGKYAIVQAPDGRVDLVSEGGEISGVKVIRIATNRVLIEYQGKQQELTIFSGLGSSPLLPAGKEQGQ